MGVRVTEDGMRWQPAWTQAMTDFRGDDEEQPFADVTVRMTVPASIGGSHVRAELSNRFGDEPVLIGRGAISVGDRSLDIAFDGQRSTEIPAGESRWTEPIYLTGDGTGGDAAWELPPFVLQGGPEPVAASLRELTGMGVNHLQVRLMARSVEEQCDQIAAFGALVGPLLNG